MLPTNRQKNLDPILSMLRMQEGVKEVWQDDFDSVGINVFISLEPKKVGATFAKNDAVFKFSAHIRVVKQAIGRCIVNNGADFNFLDWPVKKYSKMDGQNYDMGYDQSHIKIEVFV